MELIPVNSATKSAFQLFVKGLGQVTHDLVGKANTHFLFALLGQNE